MEGISAKVDFLTPFDVSNVQGAGVLITGGASGLGADLVRAFGHAGAYVTFSDVQREAGEALEKECISSGLRAKFVAADVTDFSAQDLAFRSALEFHPQKMLNIVIPNAVSLDATSSPKCPDLKTISINLIGVIYTVSLAMHYFRLPSMSARTTNKAITLVSSMAGYTSLPGGALYVTSKFGVRGLFQSMRKYVGSEGVRVNLLAPMYMETALTSNAISVFQASGIELAKLSDAVDATLRLSIDPSINGRAICTSATGNYDLCDDTEGMGASLESLDYDYTLLSHD